MIVGKEAGVKRALIRQLKMRIARMLIVRAGGVEVQLIVIIDLRLELDRIFELLAKRRDCIAKIL
ncbi:hypothetical protein EOA78_26295 [Mesorhizobium sp. M5C.F.Cr.IN.023.01.1.1]|uniref:hypothetical protein n=1 Tax=Mesorhizobium sp. M5C.F.Cr.IN.023.01.1.1 TaxID=2496768 RepID=UPI000FC9CCFE|nr:hypothetical protein [Mesorhizobium sp. M5C.F.Cr.IN.023.01.1.1]RUV68595.1 hypothetical protein EOA78_26295 [Mesorhizobium sp. M5C.F.Cr.IN.023.01.1.1]